MRDATGDHPIFVIFDRSGRAVLPSEGYCSLIGRERAGVIGRNWEEWVDPAEIDALRKGFRRAADGQPDRYMRRVPRGDGQPVAIAGSGQLIHFGRSAYVLTSVSTVFAPQGLRPDLREHREEVALYIEALAGSLANLVKAAGLAAMGDNLCGVAGEAARIARDLAKTPRLPDA